VDGSTISYTGLEPITRSTAAALSSFQNGDDVITLTIGETTRRCPVRAAGHYVRQPDDSLAVLARGSNDTIVVVNNGAGDPGFEIVDAQRREHDRFRRRGGDRRRRRRRHHRHRRRANVT
jgi:hypothetical protein